MFIKDKISSCVRADVFMAVVIIIIIIIIMLFLFLLCACILYLCVNADSVMGH